jgi:ketosteroid isomerase-like protein
MSSQKENVARAGEAVEAYRRGDVEVFLAFLDPEVDIFSTPELANPGRFAGRDGFVTWSSAWLDAWETFEIEPEGYLPVGHHHVLIPVRQRGKGKGSGVEVEMRTCYMVEIHDDLATRFHLYPDREKALEAARAGEYV